MERAGVKRVLGSEVKVHPDFAPNGIEGLRTTGSADGLFELNDGSTAVLDWKAHVTGISDEYLQHEFDQANMYVHALRQKWAELYGTGEDAPKAPSKVMIAGYLDEDNGQRIGLKTFDYDEGRALQTLQQGRDVVATVMHAATIGQLRSKEYFAEMTPNAYADDRPQRTDTVYAGSRDNELTASQQQQLQAAKDRSALQTGDAIARGIASHQAIADFNAQLEELE